jgi:hypothetical protein
MVSGEIGRHPRDQSVVSRGVRCGPRVPWSARHRRDTRRAPLCASRVGIAAFRRGRRRSAWRWPARRSDPDARAGSAAGGGGRIAPPARRSSGARSGLHLLACRGRRAPLHGTSCAEDAGHGAAGQRLRFILHLIRLIREDVGPSAIGQTSTLHFDGAFGPGGSYRHSSLSLQRWRGSRRADSTDILHLPARVAVTGRTGSRGRVLEELSWRGRRADDHRDVDHDTVLSENSVAPSPATPPGNSS